MVSLLLAALLGVTSPAAQTQAPAATAPVAASTEPDTGPATRLEDIEVVGRPLEQMIRGFVKEVAAPNPDRNLARWDSNICVGVANLQTETAQYIVDRVSTVAEDLGLRVGEPGCSPNILIVASDKPSEAAAAMIERRPLAFRIGGTGMDQGRTALNAFRTSDRPVRWWSVSVPVDAETGDVAVRIPGECRSPCKDPIDFAPVINVDSASRMRTQIVDNLNRVIVIIDANQVESVSALQLADYIALVSLAQIDPKADTSGYASILNIFEQPSVADSLTDWDTAYLTGLYESERGRSMAGANRLEVSSSIRRAHAALQSARDAQAD